MSVAMAATPQGYKQLHKACTWIVPAIAIPGQRYAQDARDQRNELFVRDASTYTIGAAAYYVGEALTKKVLTRYQKVLSRFRVLNSNPKFEFAVFLGGLSANVLYAGTGAVHVSHAIARHQAKSKANKVSPTPPLNQNIAAQPYSPSQPMTISPFPTATPSLMYPLNELSLQREKQVQYLA
jgi:hypothetical protein